MDRQTELALIDELLALKQSGTPFLDEAMGSSPLNHYVSEDWFSREMTRIFKMLPFIAAHSSELPRAGAFLRRDIYGIPVLVTRDQAGNANAFLNVCRHRGTRLVDDASGCKARFTCPYHAWTYSNEGELIAAPHFESGFPEEAKSNLGLVQLDCVERWGFIWVAPGRDQQIDLDTFLGEMAGDLDALKIGELAIAAEHRELRKANWKILVEGGIEAYHFRVAHKSTIGPYFEDNLSSYRQFGPHLRSILPRTSMAKLTSQSRDSWRLRDHANVLYTLFPANQLLVQQDHIVWISQEPVSASETHLRLVTLAPTATLNEEGHWQRNHQITSTTLVEDFDIGESIQSVATSGANANMMFGRFEGALTAFSSVVTSFMTDQR